MRLLLLEDAEDIAEAVVASFQWRDRRGRGGRRLRSPVMPNERLFDRMFSSGVGIRALRGPGYQPVRVE